MRLGITGLGLAALLVACGGGGSSRGGGTAMLPAASRVADRGITVTGTGSNPKLDDAVTAFMVAERVPNAELAVSSGGKVIFSHAYTNARIAASMTSTQTIMRLASNSKAWVSAALENLIVAKRISTSAKVFAYLGITKPLPIGAHVDPRVYDITIEDMIQHESGWDDIEAPFYDPTFSMRKTALALGLKRELTQKEYVRYQLAQPLQQTPGTTYAYCNFCYTVLGMVVAKASGMSFADYLARSVAMPLHLNNVVLSPTVGSRLPNEVANYYSPYRGLSAVYIRSQKSWPDPYGGDGMALEVAQGASAVATNAESMLALMNKYLIWGVGTPQPGVDLAREGSMEGTNTWAEQLPNGTNYAFLINTRQYKNSYAFTSLQSQIEGMLQP